MKIRALINKIKRVLNLQGNIKIKAYVMSTHEVADIVSVSCDNEDGQMICYLHMDL
jgi:hypothetical protein